MQPGTARDYMASNLVVLSPDTDVLRAMQTLLAERISGAPVVDERGNLVGLLTQRDCLTVAFGASYHQEPAGRVSEFMTREVETVPAGMDIAELVEKFYRSPYRRFPVLEDNQLVGLVSRRDVLRAVLDLWSSAAAASTPGA